ncbi:MAG: DNA translocase FtsK [Planctomycetes bacterium]|nr:DNA translocase FtsK [Planctomycetota bacterium]
MGRKRKADLEDEEVEPTHNQAGGRWSSVVRGFLFGREVDEETGSRLREIKGLVLLGVCAFVLVSMISYFTPFADPGARGWNWGGRVGFYLANGAYMSLGYAAYFGIFVAVGWGCTMVAGRAVPFVGLRTLGGVCFAISLAFLLHFVFGPAGDLPHESMSSHLPYGPGGYPALVLTDKLVVQFGGVGLLLVLMLTTLVSFLLATEMAFYPAWQGFHQWLRERREERGESMFSAVAGYAKSTGVGLWNFVRGADLGGDLATAGGPGTAVMDAPVEAATRRRARTPKVPSPDNPEGLPEIDEDDLEEEFEDELDEDREFGTKPTAEELAELEAEEAALTADDMDELSEDEDDLEADEGEADFDDDDDVVITPIAAYTKPAPVKAKISEMHFDPPTPPAGPWKFPPIDLLLSPEGNTGIDESFLQSNATKLENSLASFKVEASVVAAQVGPAVTLFELTVAQGTRMNKVTALSQEIAAALRAQSVRVIAPIPGRETIGIEVPNSKRRVVRISELVNQKAYDPKHMALPLFVGMDAEGGPVVEDLARMPHLLIAGTTGSGKSVCINTILASLLLTRSPHDVKMILIDPKMVELQAFANVPHLMCPVVTDARQATSVLLWAVEKMEGRYELFKAAGVKNVKGYNALSEDQLKAAMKDEWNDERTPRRLPYIVIVVDEFADLMSVSKKEAELAITRLAQKSRAAGLHVIVATQRPSTDVITGVIKGNLPTRIAFQVASKVDSRVILDEMGADKLLGHGDMLFLPPGGAKLKRVQGALVEDSEITRLVDFVCQDSAPNFSQELVQVASGEVRPTGGVSGEGEAEDDMFDEAVRVILKSKRGSASLLQRALGVGYTRASRLVDIMTERGIVGPYRGSKVREIMITLDQWEEMHGPSKGGSQANTSEEET